MTNSIGTGRRRRRVRSTTRPRLVRHGAVVALVGVLAATSCTSGASTGSQPTGTIELTGGTKAVNHLDVTLQLSATPDVTEMRIADGPDPTSDAWVDYHDSLAWELPATGEGARVISAQFRSDSGGESDVVSATVTYDVTPPTVAVSSPAAGATVDVSHGELGVMSGTAVDDGSGTKSVVVNAPDGSPIPADVKDGSTWTGLVSAPVSGVHQFKVTATDEAGNSATSPISLNVKAMPPTEGTVVRPSTVSLTAAEQSSVRNVENDSVEFAGDMRSTLAGKTTLISAPVAGKADDGLLRSIDSVTFDAATATTTVSTGEATLPDAFAQFDLSGAPSAPSAPAAPSASPPAEPSLKASADASFSAESCNSFVSGRTLRYVKTASFGWSSSGDVLGVSTSAALSAAATIAAYADVDLHLHVGWSPKVTGSVSAGAMACGNLDAAANASFDKSFGLPGPELGACWLIGPVPVCLRSETKLQVQASLSGPNATASVTAGFQATVPVDGAPTFSYPRSLTASAQAFGGGKLFVGPKVKLKLVAAEALESDLLTFSGGPSLTYNSGRADACVQVAAAFTPNLKVKLPFSDKSFTLFEKNFSDSLTGLCAQIWPRPVDPGTGTTGNTGGGGGSVPPAPTNLTGKIAREPDGTAWYVDKRGGSHWIPDGGTYQCLVAQGKAVVSAPHAQVMSLPNYEDARCVRANNGDIIRTSDGDSYLMQSDGSRRWIADGGTYECLRVNGHAIVDSVPRYFIEDTTKAADYSWSCWNATTARGRVVRAEGGASYYIDKRGGRHWIPDGGTYECLVAQGRTDYGNVVPKAWVEALTPYENAQCVRANPGDIITHNDGDAYLIESNWSRRWIPDGGSFECLRVNGHAVVRGVPRYYIDDLAKGSDYPAWSCWNGTAARGHVVRADDGSSWYVDLRGGRHWVPDGGTYQCLVSQGRSDYGNVVPRGWVNGLAQYENAQCVRANPGNIIRTNDGDTYVVQANWTRRWIPNGASYNCHVARGSALVNGVPRYYIDDMAAGPNYTTAQSCNLILAHTAGDSHFIDGNGFRHWIPSTTVYGCLAGRYPRFNTSDRGLVDNGWTEKERATCAM